MLYRLVLRTLGLTVLALGGALGQPLSDPVESIFRPGGVGLMDTPIPLRPADPVPPRSLRPRLPAFELKAGDRVLFLGDGLFEREAELGYLETRLASHSPTQKVVFRNLSWHTNMPLAGLGAGGDNDAWLKTLLAEVAKVKPTAVFLGYGTAASAAGEAGLAAFRENCGRLRDALRDLDTNAPVRVVWFSTVFHENPASPPPNPDPRNEQLLLYSRAIYELSTNRQDFFVPAIDILRMSAALAEARGKTSSMRLPRHMEEGLRLTPYGYSRVALAMERGLRWPANTWRFGLMTNATARPGGYGADVVIQKRTDEGATITVTEERLPAPNPAGYVDVAPDTKPQSYVQMPGFKPGQYELRVDGRKLLVNTEADWARYVIVSEGPAWDQAERLRQAIIAKNAAVTERWRALAGAPPPTDGQPLPELLTDSKIMKLEARIRELQQPARHTYEVVRVGENRGVAAPAAATLPPPTTAPVVRTNRPAAKPPPPPPLPPPPPARKNS